MAWITALLAIVAIAFAGWAISRSIHDVSIVDSLWSLFFLAAALCYALVGNTPGFAGQLLLALVIAWSLRLSVYLTWRNHGKPEDRRYQEIRKRNSPGFESSSLYKVFLLQGLLAFVISQPLAFALRSEAILTPLFLAGLLVAFAGLLWESIADAQLSRFLARPSNRGRVLDSGLWGLSRHPNYFGEAVVWWGFYLCALSAGAWWTLFAPAGMTLLLLRVSGVSLLEKDIHERRPAYREYMRRTPAFLPGVPRRSAQASDSLQGESGQ